MVVSHTLLIGFAPAAKGRGAVALFGVAGMQGHACTPVRGRLALSRTVTS